MGVEGHEMMMVSVVLLWGMRTRGFLEVGMGGGP